MSYRVDATTQGPSGNTTVVATRAFEAKNVTEAEAIADAWAKQIFGAGSLRIVRAEMILSTRMFEVARWSRSRVGPLRLDQVDGI